MDIGVVLLTSVMLIIGKQSSWKSRFNYRTSTKDILKRIASANSMTS